MRILLLHSSSDLYGASKIFLQIVSILQKKGHDCDVVLSNDGPLLPQLKLTGAKIHIFNLGIIRRKYFTPMGIVNRITKWKSALNQLNKIIQIQGIELVYSNTTAVLIGAWVAKNNNIPHYWHVHEIIEKPKFLHHVIAWFMQNSAHKIICVSRAVQKHWAQNNKKILNKTTCIYNGILPISTSGQFNYRKLYSIPTNAILIGMAGRIHYWKGQIYFLQIAKELIQLQKFKPQPNPLYFIITGNAFPGYEYLVTEMQYFIESNHLSTQVFYTGFEADMDKFYSSIDILVLPSQQPDPLPTVVLESMQNGIPVAATAQGGALEMVVENETGIFIPMDQPEKAALQIYQLAHHSQRASMGENAKKRVMHYFSEARFEQNIISFFSNEA